MEEFERRQVGVDLRQRAHRRMAESGVGVVDHAREIAVGDLAADEGRENRRSATSA